VSIMIVSGQISYQDRRSFSSEGKFYLEINIVVISIG